MEQILDPRKYATTYPSGNVIIQQALEVLSKQITKDAFSKTIINQLNQNNDELINVALNLSPNLSVCQLIWNVLIEVINKINIKSNVFAIPIVLVVDNKIHGTIDSVFNTQQLNDFFIKNNIYYNDTFIHGSLIHPNDIAKIKQSQFFYFNKNIYNPLIDLSINFNNILPIQIAKQKILLRFLVGITKVKDNLSYGINIEKFNQNLLEFVDLLHQLIKSSMNLFILPANVAYLSESYIVGMKYYQEIFFYTTLSDTVKLIRGYTFEPFIYLKTGFNSIIIDIICDQDNSLSKTINWQLTNIDDFDLIINILINTFKDMQLHWSGIIK